MRALKSLYEYENGNCNVRIFSDGTKIRRTETDFEPDFPENIDLKITSYCDGNCPMCHENSSVFGKHGNLTLPFFDTLHEGTELAIGGGNPLAHPDLLPFLQRMRAQGVLPNLTVRQSHLFANREFVQRLLDQKSVFGLGISLTEPNDELLEFCKKNQTAVIHTILGVHTADTLERLADKGLKVLLLGYKRFGRGEEFFSEEIQKNIDEINARFDNLKNRFGVLCMDNAAVAALDVKNRVTQRDFEKYYMGDDGSFTMYVDAVEEKCAANSTTPHSARLPLERDVREMFRNVRRTCADSGI